jgi:hypothetical protein
MSSYSKTSSDVIMSLRDYKLFETSFTRTGDSVLLGIFLVVGIILLTPIASSGLMILGLSQIIAILLSLFVIMSCYSVAAIIIGRPILGGCVALLVLSTVAANIPLVDTSGYPSNIGPNIWLVFFPMMLLTALLILSNSTVKPFNVIEYSLIGLVIWIEIGTFFSDPARPDVAFYTGLYFLVITTAFGLMYRYVKLKIISIQEVFLVFLVTAVGHAVYAIAQFVNQGSFGFSVLGEIARSPSKSNAVLSTPFGKVIYGLYISGFTGGSAPLSVFFTLLIPITVGYFLGKHDKSRNLGIVVISLLCAVLFLTAKESAFLGIIAAGGVLGILYSAMNRIEGSPEIHSIISDLSNLTSNFIGRTDRRVVIGIGSFCLLLILGGITYSLRLLMHSHSASIRFRQYIGGIQMTIDQPLFGVGGGNYAYTAPAYGLPEHLGGGGLFPIHSMYIGIFAETGLLGGILFLLAIGTVLRAAIINWQKHHTTFTAGIVASIVAYIIIAAWVTPLRYTNTVPFWLISGAIVAWSDQKL